MYKVESTMSGLSGSLHRGSQRVQVLLSAALLTVFAVGCATQLQAQAMAAQSARNAPPDAVIELWQQDWTLSADGSSVYHEKKHTRLNSDRSYDDLADPRITYNATTDKLEILVARVKRADGTYRELPDYCHVEVSPDASQGWPAFADIRQHLLVMSGVEEGCVLEMEYRITSQPGSKPYLAGDLRLDGRYPVPQVRSSRERARWSPRRLRVAWATAGHAASEAGHAAPGVDRHPGCTARGPVTAVEREFCPGWHSARQGRRTYGCATVWRRSTPLLTRQT